MKIKAQAVKRIIIVEAFADREAIDMLRHDFRLETDYDFYDDPLKIDIDDLREGAHEYILEDNGQLKEFSEQLLLFLKEIDLKEPNVDYVHVYGERELTNE